MRKVIMVLVCVIGVLGLALAGHEQSEEEIKRAHYCERVQDWKDSGGEYGWPPFDGEC